MKINVVEALLAEYHRLKREPLDCLEASIIDMVTDLMHLARKENIRTHSLLFEWLKFIFKPKRQAFLNWKNRKLYP